MATVRSSPGTVGLTLCHSQKIELISNSLLTEGSCSAGRAAAGSTPCPAQPGPAEEPRRFAMGDAEETSRPQCPPPASSSAQFL